VCGSHAWTKLFFGGDMKLSSGREKLSESTKHGSSSSFKETWADFEIHAQAELTSKWDKSAVEEAGARYQIFPQSHSTSFFKVWHFSHCKSVTSAICYQEIMWIMTLSAEKRWVRAFPSFWHRKSWKQRKDTSFKSLCDSLLSTREPYSHRNKKQRHHIVLTYIHHK